MSRELQLNLENTYMRQTNIHEFLETLEENKSSDVLLGMIKLVEKGVESYHTKTKRKRAPFFKVTKDLSYSQVAYIGLKGLIGSLMTTSASSVVAIGQQLGKDLFVATDRGNEVYSYEESIIKESASSGIKLVDIVVRSLPKSYFKLDLKRIDKKSSIWTVLVGEGFNKIREDNKDIFHVFTKKMMPMVCPPDDWTNMRDGGYLSDSAKSLSPLVKRSRNHPSPDGDTLYNAINHMQSVAFTINGKILSICDKLSSMRPSNLKKVFIEDPGSFDDKCPVDYDVDKYIWEREDVEVVNQKTGATSKKSVIKNTDDISIKKRGDFFKWIDKREYHNKIVKQRISADLSWDRALEVAKDLYKYEEIYWPMSNDVRSRKYPSAMTGINIQGSDYQKALVMFKDKKPIGDEEGVYAIHKTICNHWGNDSGNGVKTDKLSRIEIGYWVEKNIGWLRDMSRFPFKNTDWMKADKPFQMLAALFEFNEWLTYFEENGDYDYMSNLCAVSDASCSGAQILSAITKDDVGAKYTNLKNMAVQDLYMEVANNCKLQLELATDDISKDWLGYSDLRRCVLRALNGEDDAILTPRSKKIAIELYGACGDELEVVNRVYPQLSDLEKLRLSIIVRDLIKKPVMVKFYSGTLYGNIDHCKEFIVKNKLEKDFRHGTGRSSTHVGKIIYKSIDDVISGAGLVMNWFIHVADVFGKLNKVIKWTTRTGFKASVREYATKDLRVKIPFHDDTPSEFTIKVPERVVSNNGWEYKLNRSKMKAKIAPDITHGFDADLVASVSERCGEEDIDVWMVHDGFGTHCGDSSRLDVIIREEFVKLFSGNVLEDMYQEFKSQLCDKGKYMLKSPSNFGIEMGNYNLEEVLSSEFGFK